MEQIIISKPSGERLDNLIIGRYPQISLGKVNKYLRENKIKVNGKKQPLAYRPVAGDIINLYFPYANDYNSKPVLNSLEAVYEDACILIANKPAGLTVEAPNGADSLLARAEKYLSLNGNGSVAYLCHRLDTGTSGLVIIAKSEEALDFITSLIKDRRIKKEYVCVTFGHPQPQKATLRAWLVKNSEDGYVHVNSSESKGAKEIITSYDTIAVNGPLALLQVNLVTGRTHQIRAHLSHIGCPILGDSKYGNNTANRKYRFKYQALCAFKLSFPKISDGLLCALSEKTFEAPKPWYYEQILSRELK